MTHLREIDRAVALARRAVTAGSVREPHRLTRFLYRNWYLGGMASASTRGATPPLRAVTGPAGGPRVPRQRVPDGPRVPAQRSGDVSRPSAPWRTWNALWKEERTSRGSDLVRLFLSASPHTGLHVIAAAVTRMSDWDVPWLLTSRAVGQPLAGPDATVVYLPVDAVERLRGPIVDLVAEVQPFVASTVPALTLRIGRGVALAQNPADGRSYGEHRCSILAGSVLQSVDQPQHVVVERALTALRTAQVDPRRPYRALGATWEWGARASAA